MCPDRSRIRRSLPGVLYIARISSPARNGCLRHAHSAVMGSSQMAPATASTAWSTLCPRARKAHGGREMLHEQMSAMRPRALYSLTSSFSSSVARPVRGGGTGTLPSSGSMATTRTGIWSSPSRTAARAAATPGPLVSSPVAAVAWYFSYNLGAFPRCTFIPSRHHVLARIRDCAVLRFRSSSAVSKASAH